MKTWLGLLAARTVVLGAQSADYMLVQFACRWGRVADPVVHTLQHAKRTS